MTFCKTLRAVTLPNGEEIVAEERVDKFETTPRYQIFRVRGGIAYDVTDCARTTWARKFREMCGGDN